MSVNFYSSAVAEFLQVLKLYSVQIMIEIIF